jgi:hypothetical protein
VISQAVILALQEVKAGKISVQGWLGEKS